MAGKWNLTVRLDFSASHQIRHYQGKCEALHGHNFGVEVEVTGDRLDDKTGMMVDFKILKNETKAVLEELDHKHLNEIPAFSEISPSSENIARFIYKGVQQRLDAHGVKVARVTVSEKPAQSATYYED